MDSSFDIQRYLKEGWELFIANAANLVVATIVFLIVQIVAGFVPLGSFLVSGPMIGGMFYVLLDLRDGKQFNIMRVFDGFKLKLAPLVLVGLLTSLFTMLGLILLVLPSFLIMGWYLFSFLFVVDEDKDFWPAMEASREIGFKNHLHVFIMAFVICALNFLGVLAIGIGTLVTIPLSLCFVLKAFEDVRGFAAKAPASGAATISVPPPPPPPPAE